MDIKREREVGRDGVGIYEVRSLMNSKDTKVRHFILLIKES